MKSTQPTPYNPRRTRRHMDHFGRLALLYYPDRGYKRAVHKTSIRRHLPSLGCLRIVYIAQKECAVGLNPNLHALVVYQPSFHKSVDLEEEPMPYPGSIRDAASHSSSGFTGILEVDDKIPSAIFTL